MDKTAWEYLKEDIMETIDQYLGECTFGDIIRMLMRL